MLRLRAPGYRRRSSRRRRCHGGDGQDEQACACGICRRASSTGCWRLRDRLGHHGQDRRQRDGVALPLRLCRSSRCSRFACCGASSAAIGRASRASSAPPGTVLALPARRATATGDLDVGHNPLGAFSVFGLLAFLVAQVATGLFADDEIANTGPLIKFVSGATSSLSSRRGTRPSANGLIITLVVLHVCAIVVLPATRARPRAPDDRRRQAAAGRRAGSRPTIWRARGAGRGAARRCAAPGSRWLVSLGG